MEKKKGNTGLIIALVIFVALSATLGGYIIYDKTVKNSNEESNENSNKVDTEVKNSNSNDVSKENEDKSEISVVDFYFNSVAIVSDGSVYVNVNGGTSEVDNLFGKGTYQTLVTTRKKYKEYKFDNFEFLSVDNNNFIGMKLNVNNVKKVYSYASGQTMSSNYGLILLNEDKTLSVISLYSLINGKADVVKINGLSNIEKIVTEDNGGLITYAVDTNGKKVDLDDYVPSNYKKF